MIICGDCLEAMPELPEKSVNLILSDLPYGMTRNPWGKRIPFEDLWTDRERLLADGGSVILTASGIFTAMAMLSNERLFKYKIVWVKSRASNFLNAKRQPLRKHEDVCVFRKRGAPYFPQMAEGAPYDKGLRKAARTGSYNPFGQVRNMSGGGRYPVDVLHFPTAESGGRVWHPNQKPVALARWLVRTYSRPGDLVLDCACGAGSFPLGAKLEGRRFIGIEKDRGFAEIAAGRLECGLAGGIRGRAREN